MIINSLFVFLFISSIANSKTISHQITLENVHQKETLLLNQVTQNKSTGFYVGLADQEKKGAYYKRIEKEDYQKRISNFSKIIAPIDRKPSSNCFEKISYSVIEKDKTDKKLDLCWNQLSLNQRQKVIRWWKTGL